MKAVITCPRCGAEETCVVYNGEKITVKHDCPGSRAERERVQRFGRRTVARIKLSFTPDRPLF